MGDYTDQTMKTFKCVYCQQEKTYKPAPRMDMSVERMTSCCSECWKTPMAKRRMKVAREKFWEQKCKGK